MSPRVLCQWFLAALFLVATAAPLLADSQKLVNPQNNHSYQRIDSAATWDGARTSCQAAGGYLATVTSAQENDFIFASFGNYTMWLGGSYDAGSGAWKWVTGETFSYANWAPGQPSGVNQQNQINMWAGYSGKWDNDGAPAYPTRTYKWVCEWDPAVSCTYSLSSQSATVPRSGGSNLFFSVQASAPSCAWTASTSTSWITLATTGGTGTGPVTYSVGANPGTASRTGTITAAAKVFTVTQPGQTCPTITISPETIPPARINVPYSVALTATGGQSPYTWAIGRRGDSQIAIPSIEGGVLSGTFTTPGTADIWVTATDARGCSVEARYRFEVTDCSRPATPRIETTPGVVASGSPYTVTWTSLFGGTGGGTYRVAVSRSAACENPQLFAVRNPGITLTTERGVTGSQCVRVQAVAATDCASDWSDPLTVTVKPAPAFFAVISALPVIVKQAGDESAQPAGTLVIRNAGGVASSLRLQASGGFLTLDRETADVAPEGDVPVTVHLVPKATSAAGVRQGSIQGTWEGGFFATPVILSVLSGTPGGGAGSRLALEGTGELHFRAAASESPSRQTISVRNTSSDPIRVVPRVGPAGAWLLVDGDFVTPLSPDEVREYGVSVDRSRRTAGDGVPPLVTNLAFFNADGGPEEAAIAQVFDEEPPAVEDGAGRPPLENGQFSMVLGSAVNGSGVGGTFFVSEGWVRNRSSANLASDFYFTPDGVSGLSGTGVRKVRILVPGSATYRLSDLVKGAFGLESVSGQVEIRSQALGQLSIRSTADTISKKPGAIARYGAEIPISLSGTGVRKALAAGRTAANAAETTDSAAVLPGLRGGKAGSRTNLIFSETKGKEINLRVALFDEEGQKLGEAPLYLREHSKAQLNVEKLLPEGVSFESGSAEVWPVSGEGAATVFATVIDNASGSYSSRGGEIYQPTGEGAAARNPNGAMTGFIPAVVHSAASNNSFYTTRLVMANLSRSTAAVTLTYVPDAPLDPPVSPVTVTIPPRAEGPKAWQKDDVLSSVFGITSNTSGMLKIEGGLVSVAAETSTPIDITDLSKGRSISAFNPAPGTPETELYGLFSVESSELVADLPERSVVTYPALEESLAFRTNLILAELGGAPLTVEVRAVKAGGEGLPAVLGRRTYELRAYQRLQVNRCLRVLTGQESSSSEYKDVALEVEVVKGSGSGRAAVLATKIDNNPQSKRADIFVFGGASTGGSPVGFGN
ncbi:MAG: hypothetical protein IT186_21180 [Acidobacteria bacterium]|nr:hypothetical protein [Acidobacteriota bacterium]